MIPLALVKDGHALGYVLLHLPGGGRRWRAECTCGWNDSNLTSKKAALEMAYRHWRKEKASG